MKLLVKELDDTGAKQEIKATSSAFITAIRPHLYVHNAPSGSLFVQLQDSSGNKIADSTAITITTINATNFFHGNVTFEINANVKKDEQYFVELKSTGYTFNESAYVGWCNGFDRGVYGSDYTPSVGYSSGLQMEIWTKGNKRKGEI